jgi:DNA-binding XRE family transcriptional regulator
MNIKNKTTAETLNTIEKITDCKLTLGKLIWSIRECQEMSQVDFAKKLGISKQHLCAIEHGRKGISPRLAAIYAKKLGYLPQQFIQLALQDIVDREGFKITIEIKPRNEKIKLARVATRSVG